MKFSSGSRPRPDRAAQKLQRTVKRRDQALCLVVPCASTKGARISISNSSSISLPPHLLVPMPKLKLLPRIRPRSRPEETEWAAGACSFYNAKGLAPMSHPDLFTLGREDGRRDEPEGTTDYHPTESDVPMTVTPTGRPLADNELVLAEQPKRQDICQDRCPRSLLLPFPDLETAVTGAFATPARRRSGAVETAASGPWMGPPPLVAPQCFVVESSSSTRMLHGRVAGTTIATNERILLPELLFDQ
jgi:hypothetical protein